MINLSDKETAENFKSTNKKSVLYFTAKWCGPCKTIGPIVDDMSETYPSVAFGKIDVDQNSEAAAKFEISVVPTFVFFDGENETDKFSGADANKLEEQVKALIEKWWKKLLTCHGDTVEYVLIIWSRWRRFLIERFTFIDD